MPKMEGSKYKAPAKASKELDKSMMTQDSPVPPRGSKEARKKAIKKRLQKKMSY